MNKEIKQRFCQQLGNERVRFEERMCDHTTFRIGGPAEVFVMPESYEQIAWVIRQCRQEAIPYFILGNGSNLLVSDHGYRGVIIQLDRNLGEITVNGMEIRAAAGALLSTIAATARRASLSGFEFAGGIPGTLGGAVTMNAGAYGGEMKDVLKEVTVMNQDGEILRIPADKLELGYRTSIIKTAGYIVLEAVILLKKGNIEEITALSRKLSAQRIEKQPLEYPSAGSTFKRPEGYFAGKLIMDSDLRGYRVGGAQVSEKHCGFVVNKGGATTEDIMSVIRHVQHIVKEQTGYLLECEVKIIPYKE